MDGGRAYSKRRSGSDEMESSATLPRLPAEASAALARQQPHQRTLIASLEFQMNINVYGLIRMAQAFSPVLKANGGGVFAHLNSVASMKSFSTFVTYSDSKAAAYSITQALRELLSKQGTIVLSVHPEPIATGMGDAAGLGEIAEPPTLVAEAIIEALKNGKFHVFPDSMAKRISARIRALPQMLLSPIYLKVSTSLRSF